MDAKNAVILPARARRVLNALESAGYESYFVGGCVRDSLLGHEPKDWDIATEARPEEILGVFSDALTVGIKHGSVIAVVEGEQFEITTYRVDGEYRDHRHPSGVAFSRSLADDLSRRDFTINAMAYSPRSGVTDLFGGRIDLAAGLIRCVGDPAERFREDALRMLRAVRFAARLGFAIEPATLAAISENARLAGVLSAERIGAELRGILLSPDPGSVAILEATGLLEVIMPEISGFDELPSIWHALALVPADYCRRMALLMLATPDPEPLLIRLRVKKSELRCILSIYGAARLPLSPDPVAVRKAAIRSGSADVLRAGAELKIALAKASGDAEAEGEARLLLDAADSLAADGACLAVTDLALSGKDLIRMGMPPGERVGGMLNELLDYVAERPGRNNRGDLSAYVRARLGL